MLVVVGRFNYILFIHVSLSIYPHTKKKTPHHHTATYFSCCVCVNNAEDDITEADDPAIWCDVRSVWLAFIFQLIYLMSTAFL